MTDEPSPDEVARRLTDAFEARAASAFPDSRMPPTMGPVSTLAADRAPSRARWLAPLAAAAVVLLIVGIVIAINRNGAGNNHQAAIGQSPDHGAATRVGSTASSTRIVSSSASKPVVAAKPVKVISAVLSDGSQVGVGLPIILLLSRPITDARAFAKATTVTVNGAVVHGGWYFETKSGVSGFPIEADYRTQAYWPGHARIHLGLPVKGVSAGTGLAFANDLSLDFTTGAANVLTVDNSTHKLTVLSDGQQWPNASTTFPVSLGASDTPTKRGTKVIMEKGSSICMSGPGYHICNVKYTQRLTYGGEYLHAAPWNTSHIKNGVNSSNGCTNLTTADAKTLFDFLEIGDVVKYPNANGPLMQLGDGYGDWNVPWAQWLSGGLYPVA